jgi:DNA-binding GntR family transcriptional regulator
MPQTDSDEWPVELLPRQESRLADMVALQLREQIVDGELRSGTQLLQTQLAERLGVSRTPLREAFRILEREGLVRISNGNRTVEVAHLAVSDLLATYEVRAVIDGLAAKLTAARGLPAHLDAQFMECMADMEKASADALSPTQYTKAHATWHLLLFEASGNTCLEEHTRLVSVSSHRLIARHFSDAERKTFQPATDRIVNSGNADHRRILDAIRQQREAAAQRHAIRHMERSVEFARTVLARRSRKLSGRAPVQQPGDAMN